MGKFKDFRRKSKQGQLVFLSAQSLSAIELPIGEEQCCLDISSAHRITRVTKDPRCLIVAPILGDPVFLLLSFLSTPECERFRSKLESLVPL